MSALVVGGVAAATVAGVMGLATADFLWGAEKKRGT